MFKIQYTNNYSWLDCDKTFPDEKAATEHLLMNAFSFNYNKVAFTRSYGDSIVDAVIRPA